MLAKSSKKIVDLAVYILASIFNEGLKPILKMLDTMGIEVGRFALQITVR